MNVTNATIERLKASKKAYIDEVFEEAATAGRLWAMGGAEYAELKKVGTAGAESIFDKDSEVSIARILDIDGCAMREFWDDVFPDGWPASLTEENGVFESGFAFGACQIWVQVYEEV